MLTEEIRKNGLTLAWVNTNGDEEQRVTKEDISEALFKAIGGPTSIEHSVLNFVTERFIKALCEPS